MRPGGGKDKGSAFEREVGSALSLWLSNNERDDLITRTVISGGQFTQSLKSGTARGCPGDLMSAHPLCNDFFNQYVIECKHWNYLPIYEMLFPRPTSKPENNLLLAALQKVEKEAEQSGKPFWMLIARQNLMRTLAFTNLSASKCTLVSGLAVHTLFQGKMFVFDFFLWLEKVKSSEWLQYV